MAGTHFGGSRTDPEILDHGWSIVDFEALAFAFGLERQGRWVRKRIRGRNLQIIGAIRHRGGIPGIKFLLEIVLEQFPLAFVFTAKVNRVAEFVFVFVMRRPYNRLITLLRGALRGLFELGRSAALRDDKAGNV